jgi:hypothetical protein
MANENGTATSTPAPAVSRHRQNGPPLLIPGIAFAVLTVASAILGASGPRPASSLTDTAFYDVTHHTTLIVLGTIVFGTSIPLATWTAVTYRRLRHLGITVPGATIAVAGGLLASASLAVSGLVTWTAAQSASDIDLSLARALTDLAFATGGAGFVVPFGLLIAGVAIPGMMNGLMPRWVGWAGLVVAGIAELATLSLLTSALDPLLPVARFGGLIWLLLASVLLPLERRQRNQ